MESKSKFVKFIVYNMNTDEYEELEMESEAYYAMCEAEDKYCKEQEEFIKEIQKQENENSYYAALWEEAYEKQLNEEYVKRIREDLEI